MFNKSCTARPWEHMHPGSLLIGTQNGITPDGGEFGKLHVNFPSVSVSNPTIRNLFQRYSSKNSAGHRVIYCSTICNIKGLKRI